MRVTDRSELDDVLAYLVSEVSALHSFVGGADVRKGLDDVAVASLGALWTRDTASGGYRLDQIYEGDLDYPESLSPLQRPGVGLKSGDVITEINGIPTLSVQDADSLLRNQAGLQVLLKIRPSGGGPVFNRVVVALESRQAGDLRYSDWEISRRRRVDEASEKAIGYVHVRAMGERDFDRWARDYYPVINRSGLILDLRHNEGGNIDSWLLSRLSRRDWMWWSNRDGHPYPNMQAAAPAHIVVLVDA